MARLVTLDDNDVVVASEYRFNRAARLARLVTQKCGLTSQRL